MKSKIVFVLIALLFSNVFMVAQVGIGTITPDPSAMLDISSNSKGLLAPRMTTLERMSISNPANGLLVYDTDLNSFHYFDGSAWVIVEAGTSVIRDRFKLIKSISDLSDELSAGGGSRYLLNPIFLYEINGTIAMDFPIDLNGAQLIGRDINNDILVNNGSSSLFTGAGGGLGNITVDGNGKAIFGITGSGTQNLSIDSVIFINGSSLGTLSNLNITFFNNIQFFNNSNGLTAYDINSLAMNLLYWAESNTGTFLSLGGTFNNLHLTNGRVIADAGEVGLDVGYNPLITMGATLSLISFTGDGTRVNGYTTAPYTGYNFTEIWDVNCPGIPLETDFNATGDINLNAPVGSGFVTSFVGTGTSSRTKLVGLSTSNQLFRFSSSGNNRIVYEGNHKRSFLITASMSFQGDNNNAIFIFYLAKGNSGDAMATVVEETRTYREVGENDDVGAASVVGSIELSKGDFIEVWAERFSGSGNVLTVSLNLVTK